MFWAFLRQPPQNPIFGPLNAIRDLEPNSKFNFRHHTKIRVKKGFNSIIFLKNHVKQKKGQTLGPLRLLGGDQRARDTGGCKHSGDKMKNLKTNF